MSNAEYYLAFLAYVISRARVYLEKYEKARG